LFSLNDRADVAAVVRPDVLHLGQDDLPVDVARDILGDDILIGCSTHAEAELDEAAAAAGVDYFCAGPTWPTPTKPGRPAPGLPLLRHAAALRTARPWFAIGGIDETTLAEVLAAGARRVVVVRALTEATDPGAAAASLSARLRAAEA
jgi:thiamine-phosphate pyrophosphorylase